VKERTKRRDRQTEEGGSKTEGEGILWYCKGRVESGKKQRQKKRKKTREKQT